jgi:hypothetical protein
MHLSRLAISLSSGFLAKSGTLIPWKYLQQGRCFVWYDNKGDFAGGFAIIERAHFRTILHGGFAIIEIAHFRTILQIPHAARKKLRTHPNAEITAYFINNKSFGLRITLRLIIEVLKTDGKKFVYSYDRDNRKLGKYYAMGSPIRLYSGYVRNLEGMTGKHIENVEILTKGGILKLFMKRTIKEFGKWLLG